MNYADNDEIYQEILEIEKLSNSTLTAEQMYRIAHMTIRAYHQGKSLGFIEASESSSLTTQTETV